ncbi:MAG: hypothetical protein RLZZ245_1145 [Verrucomicrobiota bacterium]
MELVGGEGVEGKSRKKYDQAATPYDPLICRPKVSDEISRWGG